MTHNTELVVPTTTSMEHKPAKNTCCEGVIGVVGGHAVTDPSRERPYGGYLQGHIAPTKKDLPISAFKRVHLTISLLIHQFDLPLEGLHILPISMIAKN